MRLQTRVIHTHDTEENWNKCVDFVPYLGEMIVYDLDESHNYPRAKIGDGKTTIVNLPFAFGIAIDDPDPDEEFEYLDGGRIAK